LGYRLDDRGIQVRLWAGERDFVSSTTSEGLWGPLRPLSYGYRANFHRSSGRTWTSTSTSV